VVQGSERTLTAMALNLYREHTSNCSQQRKPRLDTRKPEEAPRFKWKKCDCPIYASGTLKDGFGRKKTGYTTWEEAEAVAQIWEQAGLWAAPISRVVFPAAVPQQTEGSTSIQIVDSVDAFVAK